jgi:coenzyme PQQ synthesis protein D (PqqD)
MSHPEPSTAAGAPAIDLRTVLRRRADVRYRVVDGEAVVVLQGTAEVLVLNETASRLLDLADGSAPLAAIAEALLGEYDVAPDTLGRDLLDGARELAAAGLLEAVAEAPAGAAATPDGGGR